MGSIPIPATDPATAHPSWCSPEHCKADAGGLGGGDHLSEPVTLAVGEMPGEPSLTLQLALYAYEPAETAPLNIMLRFDRRDSFESIESYWWPVPGVREIARTLIDLCTLGDRPTS